MDALFQEVIAGYRSNFAMFATKAFNIVNPGQQFHGSFAFLAIAHALSEVDAGRIQRLIITVPPRSGKSLLASIAFPAFILGRDPTRRIICASYSGELATKHARDCRVLMTHPSYRQFFPGAVLTGKNTENEMETAHGGFRLATSVGGTLLGRGGNFIIIDDLMKPDEAMSQAGRDRAWDWYTGTVGTRLDNKAEDAIIVVMQRLHVEDLAGQLLDRGGWHHLCIPAIAEEPQDLPIGGGKIHHRAVGDLIDPSREPREALERLRADMGSRMFEAQYQQQPVPDTGGIVNWPWFKTYDTPPQRGPNDWIVISWDTAMKDREVNDYSVAIVALVTPRRQVYILDLLRERLDFPSLRKRILAEAQGHRGATTLIEAAGSGISLYQDLQGKLSLIPRQPIGDKVVRLQTVSPLIEGGQVYLPARAPWLDAFRRELLSFPQSRHDDQVDALSQLLNWVRERSAQVPLQTHYGRSV